MEDLPQTPFYSQKQLKVKEKMPPKGILHSQNSSETMDGGGKKILLDSILSGLFLVFLFPPLSLTSLWEVWDISDISGVVSMEF